MEGEVFVWRYSSIFLVGWEDGNLHWHAFEREVCCALLALCLLPGGGRGFILAFTGSGEIQGVSLFTIGGTRQVVCKSVPLTVFYGEMENVARGYNVVMTGGRRWYMGCLPAAA